MEIEKLVKYAEMVDKVRDMKEGDYLEVQCSQKDFLFYRTLATECNNDGGDVIIERMRIIVDNTILDPIFTIKNGNIKHR